MTVDRQGRMHVGKALCHLVLRQLPHAIGAERTARMARKLRWNTAPGPLSAGPTAPVSATDHARPAVPWDRSTLQAKSPSATGAPGGEHRSGHW
jgi:hypothetical protein